MRIPNLEHPSFQEFAELSRDRIYVKDRSRRFVWANRATWESLGLNSFDGLRGKRDEDFFEGEHLETSLKTEETLLNRATSYRTRVKIERTEQIEVEFHRMPTVGGRRQFLCVKTRRWAARDQNGTIIGILGVTRELELPEPEEGDWFAGSYIKSSGTSGREITRYDQHFLKRFPEERRSGRWAMVHPDDRGRVHYFLRKMDRLLQEHNKGALQQVIYRAKSLAPSAGWCWMRAEGVILAADSSYYYWIKHYDLTERRAATQLASLFGGHIATDFPGYIFVKDRRGRILYMNEPFLKKLGKTMTDVFGLADFDLGFSKREARVFSHCDQKIITSGGPHAETVKEESLTIQRNHGTIGHGQSKLNLTTFKMSLHPSVFGDEDADCYPEEGKPFWHVLGIALETESMKRLNEARALGATLLKSSQDAAANKGKDDRYSKSERFTKISGLPPKPIIKATILFADIRGFSNLSEELFGYPEILSDLLSRYFKSVCELSERPNCLLDKFIGDGAMLLFGASSGLSNDPHCLKSAKDAVEFAFDLRDKFTDVVKEWMKANRRDFRKEFPELRLGIGINCGRALTVLPGARSRNSHRDHSSVFGAEVNFAQKLESMAGKPVPEGRKFAGKEREGILVSSPIHERVEQFYRWGRHYQEPISGMKGIFPFWGVKHRLPSDRRKSKTTS
ncbi:MAG TPA: adenylate/guanylate cyclase domain-containing protein [Verrucomicrobiales bacterium]|nr:adenylate/guanylate cyclase domain-containing protein [Verrucomicrobiales bacterium]